jgi:hypothetical protein
MSLESTASELRSRARDLRSNVKNGRHVDQSELADHLSAMATEIEQAARRRRPRRRTEALDMPQARNG